MASEDIFADINPPVYGFDVKKAFDGLTTKERLYAHFMSKASFLGTRIVMRQVSPESEIIFDLLLGIYRYCAGNFDSLFAKMQHSGDDLNSFLDYAAMFLGNLGNYKSSGDMKFIPLISCDVFSKLASVTPETAALFQRIKDKMYAAEPRSLGYPSDGLLSTYYPDSPELTKEEIIAVQAFLDSKGISPENTRLKKIIISGKSIYELIVASASASSTVNPTTYDIVDTHSAIDGSRLKVVFGDHASDLARVISYLQKAREYAANSNQDAMIESYIESFQTGSIAAHKLSQRHWIRDTSPSVETNMGFVESLRDPHGVRCEWDAWVAIVNKEKSKKLTELVDRSEEFILKLPWNGVAGGYTNWERSPFEAKKFLKPDFTSLEVMAYSGAQIWVGINLPNYDEIRESEGFKNVSLDNISSASSPTTPYPFILDSDLATFRAYRSLAFDISTAIHELFGHGCGLLLSETSSGSFNFDKANPPINPLNGEPITSWYTPGQTFSSVFGAIGPSYSECHAECVAIFLCDEKELLRIFGCGDGDEHRKIDEMIYISYLDMADMGLVSLESYDPVAKQWGQAHARARFALFRCLLEAGGNFLTLQYSDEKMNGLKLHMDRSKILSHGKPAIGQFLRKLHIYRSIADVASGTKLMEDMTTVDEHFLKIREVVWQKRQPGRLFVQPNTMIVNGKVVLKDYELSRFGVIQSWAEREV